MKCRTKTTNVWCVAFTRRPIGRISPRWTNSFPPILSTDPPPIPGLKPGLEGIKQAFSLFTTAHPDGIHVIHDLIAEGDRVVARVTGSGTHTGELMGIPPTGKRLEMTGIVIYRIEGGKIVERWAQHNVLGLMQQLGVIPTHGHES